MPATYPALMVPDDIIYTYSRKQAVEDGFQVKLEGELADLARQVYRYPVYITGTVWAIIEKAVANKKHHNDLKGVLWDILYMSTHASAPLDEQTRHFNVYITGAGRRRKWYMYAKCGPTDFDDPAPAITIMFPDDD